MVSSVAHGEPAAAEETLVAPAGKAPPATLPSNAYNHAFSDFGVDIDARPRSISSDQHPSGSWHAPRRRADNGAAGSSIGSHSSSPSSWLYRAYASVSSSAVDQVVVATPYRQPGNVTDTADILTSLPSDVNDKLDQPLGRGEAAEATRTALTSATMPLVRHPEKTSAAPPLASIKAAGDRRAQSADTLHRTTARRSWWFYGVETAEPESVTSDEETPSDAPPAAQPEMAECATDDSTTPTGILAEKCASTPVVPSKESAGTATPHRRSWWFGYGAAEYKELEQAESSGVGNANAVTAT
ncbi:hypothetical protein THASP1DRAFT_23336, partial [Thamnocephalis sphaerospora]